MKAFPSREYHKYLIATFVVVLCSYGTMLVDAAVGGYFLGEEAVSAINLVIPVNELFYAVAMLLGIGSAIGASITMGRGDMAALRRSFTVAISSTAAVLLLLALAFCLMLRPVAALLSAGSSLQPLVSSYLAAMVPWFVVNGLLAVLKSYTILGGKPLTVMWGAVAQFVVNLGCNVLMLGVMHWGIWALALSSLISALVMAATLLASYRRADCPFRLLRCSAAQYRATLRHNMRYGLGTLVSEVAYMLFAFTTNALVLRLMGEEALFGWSVVMMIYLVASYVAVACQEVCISIGGRYAGMGDVAVLRQLRRRTYIYNATAVALLVAAVFLFPGSMLPLFGASDPATHGALLPLVAMAIPFIGGVGVLPVAILPILQQGNTLAYSVLITLLYLHLPLLLLLCHWLLPGHEWWCFVAMVPVQAALLVAVRHIYHKEECKLK